MSNDTNQCYLKGFYYLYFLIEREIPHRATGEAGDFGSGGRSRSEGESSALTFIGVMAGKAGQGTLFRIGPFE